MMTDTNTDTGLNAVELAAELTIAWLGNSNTRANAEDVPAFLASMHKAVAELAGNGAGVGDAQSESGAETEYTPAVSVRKSLASPEVIVSMIDGRPYRSLKRHLSSRGLTPDQYRERYGLKADYPMVAPAYSEARREVAKRLGLGRKPGEKAPQKGDAAPKNTAPRKGAGAAKKAAQAHLSGDADA